MRKRLNRFGDDRIKRMSNRWRAGGNRHETIAISMVLHVALAAVFVQIEIEKKTGLPVMPVKDAIEFDLVVEENLEYEKNTNNEDFTNQDNSSLTDKIISNSTATHGARSEVEGNTITKRDHVLLASLDALDEMRSQFNAKMQQVAADSVGAFSPVSGFAPDTKSLSEALNSGLLKVNGFGRGNCTPRGGGILKQHSR